MTRFFVFCAVFSALIASSLAYISCFYGTTQQYGNSPPTGNLYQVQCPSSYYCMKIAAYGSSFNSFSYGCADYRCQRNGCTNKGNGYKECCCSSNLCNSGFDSSKTAVSSVTLAIVSALYMYI